MAKKAGAKVAKSAAFFKKLSLKADPDQWSDIGERSRVANQALTLSDVMNALLDDGPVRRAFKAFGLDPADPRHWRTLIDAFARAHFPDVRRGAPRKWTKERIERLRKHVRIVLVASMEHNQPVTDMRTIAREVKGAFGQHYPGSTENEIYRRILKLFE
jgi:phosphoglycolate phosphatase-like HAD superfamily hydrolase